jgi:Tol biopolymer transport system component
MTRWISLIILTSVVSCTGATTRPASPVAVQTPLAIVPASTPVATATPEPIITVTLNEQFVATRQPSIIPTKLASGSGEILFLVDDGSSAFPRATLSLECLSRPLSCPNQIWLLPTRVESNLATKAVWSPDGTRFAFTAGSRRSKYDIYVMNADGSGLVNLTNSPEPEYSVEWSSDGRNILFVRESQIWIMHADGSRTRSLANGCCPHWSPDGQTILYLGRSSGDKSDLFLMNDDGTQHINLTNSPAQISSGIFSPDGLKIAYTVLDPVAQHAGLYLMDINHAGAFELAPQLQGAFDPVWSPDGTKIAFVSRSVDIGSELYVVNSDGTNLVNVSRSANTNNTDPVWLLDSTRLIFVSDRNRHSNLYVVNADGTGLIQLTQGKTGAEYMLPTLRP